MKFRFLLAILFASLVSSAVSAQVQFHLAYRRPMAGAVPASFTNDSMFKFTSVEPLIRSQELTKARAFLSDGRAIVEIDITTAARKKFNDLAARNVRNQESGSFEEHVGLAVLIDGKPTQVIQGVFQSLSANKLWWSPADDRLPQAEQLRISKEVAVKIMRANPGPSVERTPPGKPGTSSHEKR